MKSVVVIAAALAALHAIRAVVQERRGRRRWTEPDLGRSQIYPISAVMQWHLLEHGTIRPYIGAGAVHTVLKNINKSFGPAASAIHFKDPTGLVVVGGLEFNVSRKWNLLADARYVPIENEVARDLSRHDLQRGPQRFGRQSSRSVWAIASRNERERDAV